MPLWLWLRECLRQALDLLYPPRCLGCGDFGCWLCPECLAEYSPSLPRKLEYDGNGRKNCFPVYSVGPHRGILRKAVHLLKYEDARALAEPMGNLLAAIWRRENISADYIVPVPLHRQRLDRRGYNQSLLLAAVLSREVGVPVSQVLSRVRDTPAQVGLSAAARQCNLAGAFAVNDGCSGLRYVLLDDVCTSGATMRICAETMAQKDAVTVAGLTFTVAEG